VEYVALGDSYSAAPGVPVTDLAGGCLRSSHDYPHLLAAAVPALRLTDVTCSGATTADLTRPQRINQVTVPAQLDALSRRTRLVTLGIGGNDLGLFGTLLGWCLEGGQNCVRGVSAHVDRDTAVIHRRLVSSLRAIHRRAPHATVVLVGYPQLVPANHLGCAGLQVAPAVLAYVGRLIARFSTMMASAARAGGATYVDLVGPSAGHDICSADPWVNGRQPTDRAIPFHPFRAEQQAVAGLLTPLVRQHVG
jgi:lysophospholipase L1-like esterase